jgi:hypothetical protein
VENKKNHKTTALKPSKYSLRRQNLDQYGKNQPKPSNKPTEKAAVNDYSGSWLYDYI